MIVTTYVDLTTMLEDIGGGWQRTPVIELSGGTTHDSGDITGTGRVDDPTNPGQYVFGPATVQLEVAPDGGHRLIVR